MLDSVILASWLNWVVVGIGSSLGAVIEGFPVLCWLRSKSCGDYLNGKHSLSPMSVVQ